MTCYTGHKSSVTSDTLKNIRSQTGYLRGLGPINGQVFLVRPKRVEAKHFCSTEHS